MLLSINEDLIEIQTEEGKGCLGYLLIVPDKGIFDAHYGQVQVSEEEAKKHNLIFDRMNITGLDQCPIGKGGFFYLDGKKVTTFLGTVVSKKYLKINNKILFNRGSMTFEGESAPDGNSTFFFRIR